MHEGENNRILLQEKDDIEIQDAIPSSDLPELELQALQLEKKAVDEFGSVDIEKRNIVLTSKRTTVSDTIESVRLEQLCENLRRNIIGKIIAWVNWLGKGPVNVGPDRFLTLWR